MTIEAIILWIGATVSLTLQYVSWENCHSSLQWVGWLNSETLRIIIEQSDWVTVRRHCNTFWHFMINFQVFGKSCLDALLIRNKIKIAVILWQRMTAILILFRIKSASRKDLPKTWKFIIKCQNVLQYFAEINRLRTWSFCYTALVSCQNFFINISMKINQFCWFSLSKKHVYI